MLVIRETKGGPERCGNYVRERGRDRDRGREGDRLMHGETESVRYAERMTRGYRCHEGIRVFEREIWREKRLVMQSKVRVRARIAFMP